MILQIFSLFFAISTLSNARRLLQVAPIDPQPVDPTPIEPQQLGFYGQICAEPQPDFTCRTIEPPVVKQGNSMSCASDYSCCMCKSIWCGTPNTPCNAVHVGGNYGAFGLQDISIKGSIFSPTILSCDGSYSCSNTLINANNIGAVGCYGDNSCSGAIMNLENSHGVACGENGCIGTQFLMTDNNGGDIACNPGGCVGANIVTQSIQNVRCDGPGACKGTYIRISDPNEAFHLICNGQSSCENLKLEIIISAPVDGCVDTTTPTYTSWRGILCGGTDACKGMQVTVINDGCNALRIDELDCTQPGSCTDAIFDLEEGVGPFRRHLDITFCKCGPSCSFATGIDECWDNLRLLACPDPSSCQNQYGAIHNPSNGFLLSCPETLSCASLQFNIIIGGGSTNLIRKMKGYECNGPMSCQGAIISITNYQTHINGQAIAIIVEYIKCNNIASCKDATFITGPNVNIDQIICDETKSESCHGCIIKRYPFDVGRPCDEPKVIIPSQLPPLPQPNQLPPIPATPIEAITPPQP